MDVHGTEDVWAWKHGFPMPNNLDHRWFRDATLQQPQAPRNTWMFIPLSQNLVSPLKVYFRMGFPVHGLRYSQFFVG